MATPIKCYTKGELANLYGITTGTLLSWIKSYNILDKKSLLEYKSSRILKTPLVAKIFNSSLGFPDL